MLNYHISQTERQTSITDSQDKVDATQGLPAELRTVRSDIEEKKNRLSKLENDMKGSSYDERIGEKTLKSRKMEDQKDGLTVEIRTLSLQADARARLDIKRAEVKSKEGDVKTT
jgi:DNA repair protein RAD50